MAVQLNHTIVYARDKRASAEFLARILGTGEPKPFASFLSVELANGVALDFGESDVVQSQHYAFAVDDAEFDAIFERIQAEGIVYYSDPQHQHKGEINTRHGRGFYFKGPEGHNLEVMNRH